MKKMPKFEGKSVKSQDSGFKLFGRTIPVKSQSDGCVEVERCEENSAENEEKLGKRPTKVVPCPRCESMDTKFCYFNNYNVNQPRHYCRKCQRYWTAGGSLRNVPVGAGRRKNKPCLGIHQRQFLQVSDNVWNDSQPSVFGNSSDKLVKVEPTYPELGNFGEALNGAAVAVAAQRQGKTKLLPQIDDYSNRSDLNLQSHKSVKEGLLLGGIGSLEECTHLAKGPEIGISAEKPKPSCSLSDKTQMSASKGESSEVAQPVEDVACDSSVNAMASKSEPQIMSPHGLPSLVGNPWSVYYNGCWGGMPSGRGGVQVKANGGVPWWAAGTGLLPAVNWAVPSAASMWGQQWCAPWRPASGVTEQKTLGKHERDEAPTKGESNGSLWVPKTMRLNDPGEALRSSFVENQETVNKPGSITSDGIFKAFQSKPGKVDSERNHPVQILCANPAALSRSASFVESS